MTAKQGKPGRFVLFCFILGGGWCALITAIQIAHHFPATVQAVAPTIGVR